MPIIGKYEFGNASYNHIFDPSGLIQRIHIQNSEIMYNSRFVRSRNWKENMKANTVIYPEIGTWGEDFFVAHNEDGSDIEDEDQLRLVMQIKDQ